MALKANGRFQSLKQLGHESESGLLGVDLPVLENVGSDEHLLSDLMEIVQ